MIYAGVVTEDLCCEATGGYDYAGIRHGVAQGWDEGCGVDGCAESSGILEEEEVVDLMEWCCCDAVRYEPFRCSDAGEDAALHGLNKSQARILIKGEVSQVVQLHLIAAHLVVVEIF